jgi:hypothetical protein
MPVILLLSLHQGSIKLLQILFAEHLANRDQELLQLLVIQQLVIVTVEQGKIALVLDLFFEWKVLLLFDLVEVDLFEEFDLGFGRDFGQVVGQ